MGKLKKVKIKEITSSKETLLVSDEDYSLSPLFALCSASRRQATEFTACRESLTVDIYNRLMTVNSPYRSSKKNNKIDTRKMRLLTILPWDGYQEFACLDKEYDKGLAKARGNADRVMLTGLKLVNHFEKIAKWPLTQLYRASYEHLPTHVFIYLMIGTGRWMRSPHMVSLFALLTRLGRFREFEKFRNHKKFLEICEDLIANRDDGGDGYYDEYYVEEVEDMLEDIYHLKTIYRKIEMIVKNFRYLFGNRTAQYSFSAKAIPRKLIYGEGISRLCDKSSGDYAVAAKFAKLCKRYGR